MRCAQSRIEIIAGMWLGRAGRHVEGVFSVRLMKRSRTIVINAPVSAVSFSWIGNEMTPKCTGCKRDQDDCVCDYQINPVVIDQIVRQQEEIEDLRRRLAASYARSAENKPRLCSECAHSSPEPGSDRSLLCHHKMVEADDPLVLSGLRTNACTLNERAKRKGGVCGIKGKLWEAK